MVAELPAETPDLFGALPEDYWIGLSEPEREKRFTGAQVAKQRALLRAVVGFLGLGRGVESIAAELNLSPHTVRVVRERWASEVAGSKERFAADCMRTAAKCVQRVGQCLDSMSGAQAAVAAGILYDKAALSTGLPTSITATKGADVRPEQVAGWWSAPAIEVESQAQTVECESTDVASQHVEPQPTTIYDALTDTSQVSVDPSPGGAVRVGPAGSVPVATEGGGGGDFKPTAPGESMGPPAQ